MTAVTDQTRVAVWNALCDLEWNARYYLEMSKMWQKRHRLLRYGIVGGVFLDGALFYAGTIYPWLFLVAVAGGLVLAALTIWDAFADHAEDAAIMRLTSYACDDLTREIERLWRAIDNGEISNEETESRFESISDRWARATERVRPRDDFQLKERTSRESNLDIENRYAV